MSSPLFSQPLRLLPLLLPLRVLHMPLSLTCSLLLSEGRAPRPREDHHRPDPEDAGARQDLRLSGPGGDLLRCSHHWGAGKGRRSQVLWHQGGHRKGQG